MRRATYTKEWKGGIPTHTPDYRPSNCQSDLFGSVTRMDQHHGNISLSQQLSMDGILIPRTYHPGDGKKKMATATRGDRLKQLRCWVANGAK